MDLEFNQPFDFGDGDGAASLPQCPFEVVQVGLVKLAVDFSALDTLELTIRPTIYKRIHPFVRDITGISNKDLLSARYTFPQVFRQISDFIGGSQNIFGVWGGSDVKLLLMNINFHGLDAASIPTKFIDVQCLASRHLGNKSGMAVGLKNAVTALGLEQDAPFHNALGDATYTARIFKVVAKNEPNLHRHIKICNALASTEEQT